MLSDEALSHHLAGLLVDAGIGTTTATPGAPFIAAKRVPPTPDVAIGVTVYLATDSLLTHTRRAQFRFRGAPNDPFGPDRIADQVFRLLHMRHHDGHVSRISRESIASLGMDGNKRDERTDNYDITLNTGGSAP